MAMKGTVKRILKNFEVLKISREIDSQIECKRVGVKLMSAVDGEGRHHLSPL